MKHGEAATQSTPRTCSHATVRPPLPPHTTAISSAFTNGGSLPQTAAQWTPPCSSTTSPPTPSPQTPPPSPSTLSLASPSVATSPGTASSTTLASRPP